MAGVDTVGGDGAERYSWSTVEAWAKGGQAERIGAAGAALAAEARQIEERLRALHRDLTFMQRVLALTPGRAFLQRLVALSGQVRYSGASDECLLASLIAEAQCLDDALYVLWHPDAEEHHELRACLFHELLLRGAEPGRLVPAMARRPDFRPGHWSGLSWLPDRLTQMEGPDLDKWLPSRRYASGASGSVPAMKSPTPVDAAARRAGRTRRVREATPAHLADLIRRPAQDGRWCDHEARVFVLDEPVAVEELPQVVTALPMDCLRGLGGRDRFEGEVCTLDSVWLTLFMTASTGGVGSAGVHGAWGRFSAWLALAGLCGAEYPEASALEVEEAARACRWYRFEADTAWFHNDMNDYGIVALSPDGRRIAVLAATDTD
ncbi:DUF6183 family protein [Streptomyces sp. SP2-10]|uniref:DUF6183 family protein n=1 Tax=Streptomyces sp. SP2-10 TaxID=2873385 RepID=UPI001CA60426|nr:DUF6183 family protein [Streptomyces sp. SP2-10]MBY8846905.1 DUF6183 family protein [Streptomyces sp. SP2-10]